jgi:L-rhamnose mutarotase
MRSGPRWSHSSGTRASATYTISRHGLTLFAYLERPDDAAPASDPGEVIKRWSTWMAPHMETHPDDRPVVEAVEEVFRLD